MRSWWVLLVPLVACGKLGGGTPETWEPCYAVLMQTYQHPVAIGVEVTTKQYIHGWATRENGLLHCTAAAP